MRLLLLLLLQSSAIFRSSSASFAPSDSVLPPPPSHTVPFGKVSPQLLAAWRAWFGAAVRPVRCLLIIDVQNDFIDGTLSIAACPAGQVRHCPLAPRSRRAAHAAPCALRGACIGHRRRRARA